jgi:hypothetical protein
MFEHSMSLEICASKEDIQRYLKDYMSKLLKFVRGSSDLQKEITANVIKAVDRM